MRNIHFATHLIYYSVHPISFLNVWGGRFMDEKHPIVTNFHLLDSAWSRYHFRSGGHGRLCHFLAYIIWHNLPVMMIHFVVIIATIISVEHLFIHFFNLWKKNCEWKYWIPYKKKFDIEISKIINYSIYTCVGNTLVPWQQLQHRLITLLSKKFKV
jgi:hypothetical protein